MALPGLCQVHVTQDILSALLIAALRISSSMTKVAWAQHELFVQIIFAEYDQAR
jgi:hypothetical protein